jgi:RHS repeat-associated protein
VGTVKALTDPDGTVVKRLEYDSFGLPLLDTCPYFFLPLGFAGGLVDRHTGLVRFGFRDYDPRTGRFTAPAPLGDTGGDHDLYDYCVDDPVSAYDPTGLIQQGLAARGWDESEHPRATDGRFTFAHGGAAGSAAARGNVQKQEGRPAGDATGTRDVPTAGADGQGKSGGDSKAKDILQRLRPWWMYPYGSKEKQDGIAKMQEAMTPNIQGWAKTMENVGRGGINAQEFLLSEGAKMGIDHMKKKREKRRREENAKK